jgi:hypothetical protein
MAKITRQRVTEKKVRGVKIRKTVTVTITKNRRKKK